MRDSLAWPLHGFQCVSLDTPKGVEIRNQLHSSSLKRLEVRTTFGEGSEPLATLHALAYCNERLAGDMSLAYLVAAGHCIEVLFWILPRAWGSSISLF
jgi:hypothetical protein